PAAGASGRSGRQGTRARAGTRLEPRDPRRPRRDRAMPTTIARLDAAQLTGREPAREWDGYCAKHPAGTPYHLSAWVRAVAAALGHEPHYLYAHEAGSVTGVLPLFLRKSRLFGTNLVSVPAANVGGPLADDDATAVRLLEEAVALAAELNV